ncbi:MAG: HAMP domain-containing histidine kinase [Cyclobacteriaceae bacterium]|nr:HAMP domain-containing histidine kinase [Cyclobacteriaceae bacterium]
MKSGVIRAVIVLATISIVGIATTQIYWLKKAFDLNENQFNRDVNTSLYTVASKLFEISSSSSPEINPIEQLSTNYYVVTISNEIDAGTLEFLLKNEFQKRNIQADFEYGIYDCNNDRMVYGNYVSFDDHPMEEEARTSLPKWGKQQYYFGVYFPSKEIQIINRMEIWVFSTIVLFVVIVFFAYASFIILKQKRLSEIQKDFINNMTHEFKTPISTISVSSEVLKNPEIIENPGRLMSYATIIQNESHRLKTQVDRVLQMATLEDEQITLKKEKFDVHQVINETIVTLSPKIEKLEGEIKKNFEALESSINADKLHFTNLIYNLLDNAIKYCGNNAPKIEIVTKNEKQQICIQIKDTGIGIEKKEQQKIFSKFYRVPTGNVHDVKGFGLGLYYVKLMIKAHHGSINSSSKLGRGSVFSIFFPLAHD